MSSIWEQEQPAMRLDAQEARRLIRKCDRRVVPILMILYLFAFLDRINIGNARLQGLEKDLNMKDQDYNIALLVLFIPYILCEIPCNLIMRRLAPSTWISAIMVIWGGITICQGFVQNRAGLIACRFLIGVFEAGFLPGCVYLIAMYYRRYELQWRLNLFFSASILAGAISGLLAYGLAYMDGVRGYSSWRWIFILEGLATVVLAVVSKALIADWPETAGFLTERERQNLLLRLSSDQQRYRMDRLDKPAMRHILQDWKIYIGTLMYLGPVSTGYAASFFMPSILQDMGWTSLDAQIMSVPIYIAVAAMTLGTALLSDRAQHRFGFIIGGCFIATVGDAILLCTNSIPSGAKYFALYAVTGGGFVAQPIVLGWVSNNMSGHYKQAIASAYCLLPSEAPGYRIGYGTSLGLIWLCGIAATLLFFGLRWKNCQRDYGNRDYLLRLDPEEVDNLGDAHPRFRFTC
ncbi:MFS transporter [Aspergillus steynii IBT 23096]|uniref:MFS transporter n=1 Tax=Aspergillus steynii IBT 23096 TaxID=1392250 RepID=A0A2I2GB21_9EURO|nr:MFS transporter [Aspergillus steynii IBT 23096]PLB50079.1 MFS transporter [Aspergillus steynii IBT 23096]